MGKKGVIMDNGRKAQSSMALYWKKNKEASKHPKQKKSEQDEKQITDKSVQSNFDKWKTHKQKLISKAYTQPTKTNEEKEKKSQKENDDDQLMQRLMESKKPKITTIPGFRSKNELTNKLQLQIQKPQQADQSTNILRLPSHMQALTQEQIVQMLRERKSKQQMQKRMEAGQNGEVRQVNVRDDVMLMDQFINLKKKKQKEEEKEPIIEEVKEPQPEPAFFKSDLLNKIQKQGIDKVLAPVLKVQEPIPNPIEANQDVKNSEPQKMQDKQNESEVRKPITLNPKFLPRALKK